MSKSTFVVTAIHRDDLKWLGFDTENIPDQVMERLASKMANDYLNQLYWSSMEIIAEDMGIKKLENPSSTQTDEVN